LGSFHLNSYGKGLHMNSCIPIDGDDRATAAHQDGATTGKGAHCRFARNPELGGNPSTGVLGHSDCRLHSNMLSVSVNVFHISFYFLSCWLCPAWVEN
jgi:hypothetical protein